MNEGLPILLDVRDRPCLIVGGGAVAARKARQLLGLGARVRVVSPAFGDAMPAGVERVEARFDPRHLDPRPLVLVAATDVAAVNDAAVAAAGDRGVITLRADAGDAAAASLAATSVGDGDGSVTLAATAGGAALSVAVRDHLAERLDRRYLVLAEVMRSLRGAAIDTLPPQRRRALFRRLASAEALAVAGGGAEAVRRWLAAGP